MYICEVSLQGELDQDGGGPRLGLQEHTGDRWAGAVAAEEHSDPPEARGDLGEDTEGMFACCIHL